MSEYHAAITIISYSEYAVYRMRQFIIKKTQKLT